jgi:hypothetical protein
MGACGACFVSNGPRGDLLTPVPFRGWTLSRARGSCRSRVLRGMGACGARSVSNGPRGDLLTHVPFRGLKLSRARGSCRSRVQRGMGACGARSVSNGPRGDLLTPVPFRGWTLSRARGSCRSRVLRGMGACGARFVSKRASRRPSHACTLSRVEIIPSQELVPLEGSLYFVRNRAIECSIVEAAVSRHGRAFLGVVAARARSGRRGQADVTACHGPCYSSP